MTSAANSSTRARPSDGQLAIRWVNPAARNSSASRRTESHDSEIDRLVERPMPAGSRPAAYAARSMTADFRASSDTEPKPCHTSAWRAARGSMTLAPPAPIQIGGCGCCTGRGR